MFIEIFCCLHIDHSLHWLQNHPPPPPATTASCLAFGCRPVDFSLFAVKRRSY
ncbi:hypothetical protein BDQ17DRAFT_1342478 [Cyathus striatus]|nr:hypothetical protein BDQ17DRAFT_1342478 [Cyathus striatus]